jgi:hypothetical protein
MVKLKRNLVIIMLAFFCITFFWPLSNFELIGSFLKSSILTAIGFFVTVELGDYLNERKKTHAVNNMFITKTEKTFYLFDWMKALKRYLDKSHDKYSDAYYGGYLLCGGYGVGKSYVIDFLTFFNYHVVRINIDIFLSGFIKIDSSNTMLQYEEMEKKILEKTKKSNHYVVLIDEIDKLAAAGTNYYNFNRLLLFIDNCRAHGVTVIAVSSQDSSAFHTALTRAGRLSLKVSCQFTKNDYITIFQAIYNEIIGEGKEVVASLSRDKIHQLAGREFDKDQKKKFCYDPEIMEPVERIPSVVTVLDIEKAARTVLCKLKKNHDSL